MTNLIACVHLFYFLMPSINFHCHNRLVTTCPYHYSTSSRTCVSFFFPQCSLPLSLPQPPQENSTQPPHAPSPPPHSSPPLHLPCVRRWSRRSNGGAAGSLPLAHLRCLGFPPPAASSNPGDGGSDRRSNPGRGGSDSLPRFFAAPHRSPRAFWGRSIATRPEASGYRELAVFSLPFFPVCVPDAEKQWIIVPH